MTEWPSELSPESVAFLEAQQWTSLTPVQKTVLPIALKGICVTVKSETGSGKTIAYCIPLIEHLRKASELSGLVGLLIAPTKDLAAQVFRVLNEVLSFHPLDVQTLLVSGSDEAHKAALAGWLSDPTPATIIVATPGRLHTAFETLEASGRRAQAVRCFEYLVLDEWDRLLRDGGEQSSRAMAMSMPNQVKAILRKLPKQRVSGIYSATMPQDWQAVARLVHGRKEDRRQALIEMSHSEGTEQAVPATLDNRYLVVDGRAKIVRLLGVVRHHVGRGEKVVVFCLTCEMVDYLFSVLQDKAMRCYLPDVPVFGIHGRKRVEIRNAIMGQFRAAGPSVMIATNLLERGIDIPDVDIVVQTDPPIEAETFVHRVGRAGRAGKAGMSVVLLDPQVADEYVAYWGASRARVDLKPVDPEIAEEYWPADGPGGALLKGNLECLNAEFYEDRTKTSKAIRERKNTLENDKKAEAKATKQFDKVAAKTARKAVTRGEKKLEALLAVERDLRTRHRAATHPVLEALQGLAGRDRAVWDGQHAVFKSMLSAHRKHQLRLIMSMERLDIGALATGLGLLRLPNNLTELRRAYVWFDPVDVDVKTIAYQDPKREAARQAQIAKFRADGEVAARETAARTRAAAATKAREERREAAKEAKRRGMEFTEVEMDELEDDYKATRKGKRARKGKK